MRSSVEAQDEEISTSVRTIAYFVLNLVHICGELCKKFNTKLVRTLYSTAKACNAKYEPKVLGRPPFSAEVLPSLSNSATPPLPANTSMSSTSSTIQTELELNSTTIAPTT